MAESSALAADPTRCPAQTLLSCVRTSCEKQCGRKKQQGGDFEGHARSVRRSRTKPYSSRGVERQGSDAHVGGA